MGDWLRLYGPALLACALTTFRVAVLRAWAHYPARRAVFLCMAAMASSLTVNTPWVYDAVWRLTGVPNLARLLAHALMLMVAWQIRTFVLHVSHPDTRQPRRWEAVWLALVLVGMCATFALTDAPVNDVRFANRYQHTPGVLEYWLVFICYLVPVLCRVIGFALREARQTENDSVRAGLCLIAMGTACTVLYHLHKAAFFVGGRFGVGYPGALRAPLDTLLTPMAAVLVFVGLSLPSWGVADALLGRLRRRRLYLWLRPLWQALYHTNPGIALMVPASYLSEMFAVRDLDLRLYRRFVEIRDGRSALRPHMDPRVANEARREGAQSGLAGQRLEAYAEAAMLDAAIRARARGPVPDIPAGGQAVPGGVDLSSDVAFLALVSRAYRKRQRRRHGS
ncbi:MAB_1171c family putative transporter [Microtetraspora malaysiensis]|uniref:MAB_1171c family putative transporter n=1 Tax=Microtetraspora malaysiensis TaxID=161358 RepID=A0ABW6T1Z1_9ACTN